MTVGGLLLIHNDNNNNYNNIVSDLFRLPYAATCVCMFANDATVCGWK